MIARKFAAGFSFAALCALALAATAAAQGRPSVVVTPGGARSFRAAVQVFADRSLPADPGRAPTFQREVGAALDFSGLFQTIPHAAFLGPVTTPGLAGSPTIQCGDWTQIGADALVEGEFQIASQLSLEVRIWDVARCMRLARKIYREPASVDRTRLAHRVADDIIAAFTGIRGVSSTEITFVSTRDGRTEIYVMDAMGTNQRRATRNASINNFPSWTPGGDGIVYTSYRHQNRPLVFLSSRGSRPAGRLFSRLSSTRSEYRAVFSPSGTRVASVMSEPGQSSDIYVSSPDGSNLRRLTRDRSIEISPTWSPDEQRLAFVSDRSGSPQVYVMNADGSNVRRLTFQGNYCTSPTWSPDGRWIAYEKRVGGQFDIWLIDPEGGTDFPLVEHPRNDESPSWSPDSRMLVFASTRRGRNDIYSVDAGGQNLRQLTQGAADNKSPSWGPYPR